MQPTFPLHVLFDDGDEWTVATPYVLAISLEWFDSQDGDNSVIVVDSRGRFVDVKVEALEVVRLGLQA